MKAGALLTKSDIRVPRKVRRRVEEKNGHVGSINEPTWLELHPPARGKDTRSPALRSCSSGKKSDLITKNQRLGIPHLPKKAGTQLAGWTFCCPATLRIPTDARTPMNLNYRQSLLCCAPPFYTSLLSPNQI